MSVLQQMAVAAFSAAALLTSPAPEHRIDLKMSSTDGIQRIDPLWMVTYVDEAGREIVVQGKLTTGEYAPLIAADAARLESMMGAARGMATAMNIKMRLVKFTSRIDVEEIRP